ncbi:sensor histidine kinase [Croceivirga thetidis]|uniref:Histidine kinase n=1 Tax=Croceivirga thetidis TaxID=2721623 RepID=A0ABX1GUC6_9FLAO|nr:histidine kinase [Croceivirga thetidis]NKI33258.1 histidine kinase [Croceivirga thetidis]
MNFLEKNRNMVFWGLQLLGWGFINLISIFVISKFGTAFVVFSITSGMFVGIFSTSLLRAYLKKEVGFENFGITEIIKILLSSTVAAGIYGFLSYGLGYAYGKYGPELSELEHDILKSFDNVWLLVINSIFIIGVWTVCYLVIKLLLRLNKNRLERLQLNSTLKQAQLNTLKGQINPHFMFNSLNNIRGLMLEDVEKSREMLTKLSEMLRYSLTKNDVNAIALEEELEMVDNYIALSKIQFEDRLQFTKIIEKDTEQIQIPPMLIQLLIENAAKHGISNLKQGGTISLETKKNGEYLLIDVTNSGQLKIAKDSTQLGLKNIKQRLKLLYGDKASFVLNEGDGEVLAQVKIPLVK